MAMASQVFPPAKRRRVVAPSFDHHRLPCFPNTYQPAPEFQYQKIPAANPVPTMGNNKPVCFHPMQGKGFFVKNPNPGIDVVPTPRMVKPAAPVQGFQRHQYGQQGFVRSQLHLQSQSFSVQNRSVDAFSFTSSTVNRVDQVQCLNQHPHPVAPVSNQVTLDQLSTSVLSMLVQSIKAQQGLLIAQQPKEEAPVEEDVPSDFDAAWLKVRHESVIKSLYSDIPRQCSTCGRRFKTQEEHSKHMDWHVLKNREIKKTKQVKRSKPWFFTPSLWLKATEILTESNNGGPVPEFLKRDSILDMEKDEDILRVPRDEDFIVLGDEDQRFCALCMEAFEEFYSDETEDWMYKGAVYMNAPKGSMGSGKDGSQLGPIVHFKCLPDSRQL